MKHELTAADMKSFCLCVCALAPEIENTGLDVISAVGLLVAKPWLPPDRGC